MEGRYFFVYILISKKDRKLYIGFTSNLNKRLRQHKSGEVKSTRARRLVILIHFECFINKGDALAREAYLKSGFGRNQIKKALKNTLVNHDYRYR